MFFSTADFDQCIEFSKNHFDSIKDKLNVQPNSFKFKKITYSEVEYLIRNMDNSARKKKKILFWSTKLEKNMKYTVI